MLTLTDAFVRAYPDAHMGILAMERVINPPSHHGLDAEKKALEKRLRKEFGAASRSALVELESIRPYVAYYKQFRKTYHVLLQMESVIWKEKSLPRVAALVEAMFLAELRNHLLTAGHDLDAVELPLRLDAARGGERFILLGGGEAIAKENDMFVADAQGILSTVLNGPDYRTRIREKTTRVLFTVYAPAGISRTLLQHHLNDLETTVRIVSPTALTVENRIYP